MSAAARHEPQAGLIAVFDTETTGLTLHPHAPLSKQPKIIEFGGVLLDPVTGAEVLSASILINPCEPLTAEITKITGLTDEDLKGAAPFPEVEPQLREFFRRASTVVAHNLPFDRAMMFNDLARHDIKGFPWPRNEVCTVGLYRDLWGRNPKLLELYEWAMGKPLAQTHRALDDVRALVEIIQKERLWEVMAPPPPELAPPAGYTAEELERDNPYNAWMYGP